MKIAEETEFAWSRERSILSSRDPVVMFLRLAAADDETESSTSTTAVLLNLVAMMEHHLQYRRVGITYSVCVSCQNYELQYEYYLPVSMQF